MEVRLDITEIEEASASSNVSDDRTGVKMLVLGEAGSKIVVTMNREQTEELIRRLTLSVKYLKK